MPEPLQQEIKASVSSRGKIRSSQVGRGRTIRNPRKTRSVEDLSPAIESTDLCHGQTQNQTVHQTLTKISNSSRRYPSEHKRSKKNVHNKRNEKTPSPNAVAQASRLFESPRSITPPNRALSDNGLLVGNHSLGGKLSPRVASHISLQNLYSSSHDLTKVAKAKPLWMKAETKIRDSTTPTRQRHTPPPESPLANNGRLMLQQRKLERYSGHDTNGFGMQDAVQRRRRKHFEKCEKAATDIQKLARGWLERSNSNQSKHIPSSRMVHKQGKTGETESNKGKKNMTGKMEQARVHNCVSPKRQYYPTLEPNLTPMQNAMRKSLRRLGVSQRDIMLSSMGTSEKDLFSNSLVRGSQRNLMGSMVLSGSPHFSESRRAEAEHAELEQTLCDLFRSNIANVTARARRRSIHG